MLKIEPRTLSMLGKYSVTATSAAQEITNLERVQRGRWFSVYHGSSARLKGLTTDFSRAAIVFRRQWDIMFKVLAEESLSQVVTFHKIVLQLRSESIPR